MTLEEVAEALSVSTHTVSSYRKKGVIPRPIQLAGRSLRWREADINEWIAAGCPQSEPAKA